MTQKEMYERLLAEKDQEIAFLRSLIGSDVQKVTVEAAPSEPPLYEIQKNWLSEEEEDIRTLIENNVLTQVEADAALAALTEGMTT